LGWRAYTDAPGGPVVTDWDALRVEHLIPEAVTDLVPDDSYILEMGFERLHGVDFRKGCYVGQEVTARMKHKTELRKGLVRVAVTGAAAPGTLILSDGREAGRLGTRAGDRALAWLRLDRAATPLQAGDATVAPE
jgi:folate-binding protein YgfZ